MDALGPGHAEGNPAGSGDQGRPPSGTQILPPAPPEARMAAFRRAVLGKSGRVQLTAGQREALRRRSARAQLRDRVAQAVREAADQGLSHQDTALETGLSPRASLGSCRE